MKENRAFTILFCNQKTIKKQTGFAHNFLETPIQSIERYLNPLFQGIVFLLFPLFQKYLNHQVRTNEW